MSSDPIADYALLSDCHSAALVGRGGSIDWLCWPRFDAPAIFARILDESAGFWAITPVGDFESSRRYIDGTLVLETTFKTATGEVVLIDALAVGSRGGTHGLGQHAPHVLLRQVRCVTGEVELGFVCAPRGEYGLVRPVFAADNRALVVYLGADVLALSGGQALEYADGAATTTLHLTRGQVHAFALSHGTMIQQPATWSRREIERDLRGTVRAWRSWSDEHSTYRGIAEELVHHSGRVLKGLTYQPTGAIIAAPTTSLPEQAGGGRNWDYRYAWVRDASLTLEALWVAGCPHEAYRFFTWMAHAAAASTLEKSRLQIMFGIGGEHDLSERVLPHLSGWRDSSPVRVGNAAWEQAQLDVYGALLGAAARLRDQLDGVDQATREFLVDLADLAAQRWHYPDQGIWEVRGAQQHFVHSKLMCWVALDRAIDLAPVLEAEHRTSDWRRVRQEIADAILEHGWSDTAGAYTQAFGSDALDASVLLLSINGFLPGDDPRMRATVEAIADGLRDERGLVYRYRSDDGLEGDEGTFLLCTFWLARALALGGEVERATTVFRRAIAYANDVGLMAEEVDPASGELLGNFPQAFSHVGLVGAAWAIEQVS